jgi:hypothetical protein
LEHAYNLAMQLESVQSIIPFQTITPGTWEEEFVATTIYLGNLSSGAYMIKATTDYEVAFRKFIKR